jgi:hypothetical protein
MSSAIALPPELTSISGAFCLTLPGTQSGAQSFGGAPPGCTAHTLPATSNITPANADATKFILVITAYSHTSLSYSLVLAWKVGFLSTTKG